MKKKKKKGKKSMTHYFGRLPTNRHYTVPFFRRLTKRALAMLALVFLIALAMLVGKQLHSHPTPNPKHHLKLKLQTPLTQVDKCLQLHRYIAHELARYESSPFTHEMVCAVISVESSFRANVVSNYGAMGIMQVTLHVLNDYNLYADKPSVMLSPEMKTVANNIKLGVWYLHRTHRHTKKYAGSQSLPASLSAYNWGLTRAISQRLTHTRYSAKVLSRHHYFQQRLKPNDDSLEIKARALARYR